MTMIPTSTHVDHEREIISILDYSVNEIMKLGIKAVSMDDLSKSLGMSKKTLYGHFTSKRDLIEKSILRHLSLEKQVIDEIHTRSVDAIDEMAQIAEHTVVHFRQISPVLIHDLQKFYKDIWSYVVTHQTQYFFEKIENNISRGIAEGYYRKNLDAEIVTKLYVAKSFSLVDDTLFDPHMYSREHLVKQHIQYHLHGILTDTGRKHMHDFHSLMI